MNINTKLAVSVLTYVAAIAIIAPIGAAQASTSTPSTSTVITVSTQCQEDEPCWDCKTMGNKICGPTFTSSK